MDGRTRPTYNAGEFFTLRKLPCAPFFLVRSLEEWNRGRHGQRSGNVPRNAREWIHDQRHADPGAKFGRSPFSSVLCVPKLSEVEAGDAVYPVATTSNGESARGYLPQLLGQPSFRDSVGNNTVVWMPRWQNLKKPREERFIRGYSVYPGGGCTEFPWYAIQAQGFGSGYKHEIKRRYPTPVSFTAQAPSLRSDTNYVDIDPEAMCATRAYF